MLERFRFYVLFDHRTRVRNDLLSLVFALLYYLLTAISSISPERNPGYESLIVLACGMGFTTLWYCSHPQRMSTQLPRRRIQATLAEAQVPRSAVLASIGVVILSALFPASQLEAALIDRRIRKALKHGPPYNELDKVLDEGMRSGLRASPSVLKSAATAVRGSLNAQTSPQSAIYGTLTRLNAYSIYTQASLSIQVAHGAKRILFPATAKGYRLTRGLDLPSIWIQGESTDSRLLVDFGRVKSKSLWSMNEVGDAVIQNLTIEEENPYTIELRPDVLSSSQAGARAVFMNVTIIGLSQDLGVSAVWLWTTFKNCSLRYSGESSIQMLDVIFVDCAFDFSKTKNAQMVLDVIQSSPSQPVSIAIQA